MIKTGCSTAAVVAVLLLAGASSVHAQQGNWDQGVGNTHQGLLDQPTMQRGGQYFGPGGQQPGGQQQFGQGGGWGQPQGQPERWAPGAASPHGHGAQQQRQQHGQPGGWGQHQGQHQGRQQGQQGAQQQMPHHTDGGGFVERRPGHYDQRGQDQQFGQTGVTQQGQTRTFHFGDTTSAVGGQQQRDWQ